MYIINLYILIVVGCFSIHIASSIPNRRATRHVTLACLEALRDEPNQAAHKQYLLKFITFLINYHQ